MMHRKYKAFTPAGSALEPENLGSISVMFPRPAVRARWVLWVLEHDSDQELTVQELKAVERIDENTMRTKNGLVWRRHTPNTAT